MTRPRPSPRLEQVTARLLTQGLLLATGPLLARSTGPAGRGEAAVGVALAVLLPPVVGLGFGSAVRARWSATDPQLADLRRAGWQRTLWGGVLATLIGVAVVVSGLLDLSDAIRPVIVFAAATAGLSAFVDGLVSLRLIEDRQRQAALTRVLPVAVFAFYCVVCFATDRLSATTYVAGYATLPLLRFAVVARPWSLDAAGRTKSPTPAASVTSAASWRTAGIWGMPHELSDAGLAQIAVLAAGLTLGATELGLFSVALTMARVPNFVASGVSDSDVAQIAAARGGGATFDALGAALRLIAVMSAVSGVTALLGWFAVPFVFGTEFAPARLSMLILLLASPSSAAIGYLSSYFVGFGNVVASARLQLGLFVAVAVGTGIFSLIGAEAGGQAGAIGRGSLWASIGFSAFAAVVGAWAIARARSSNAVPLDAMPPAAVR